MTEIERVGGSQATVDQDDLAEWLRAHWITVVALVGLALQLWWRAGLLSRFYFLQGDFSVLDRAKTANLGLGYLFSPVDGQLSPGARTVAWIEARASLYNWPLASAGTLALLGLSGLACYWLLRTLLGDRPAVLLPFALYLVTPLLVPELTWWSAAICWLPLQVAIFSAVAAHVRYVRTGKLRYVALAVLSIVVGEVFAFKGVLVPVLLFALTIAFGVRGAALAAVRSAAREYARAWLAYAAVALGYLAVVAFQLGRPGVAPGRLPSAGSIAAFGFGLLRLGLVPGSLGGPWHWQPLVGYAVASPPVVLVYVSLAVVALIFAASLVFRARAWRAWAVILAWFIVADIGSALLSPYNTVAGSIYDADLNFIADLVPVVVICAGLVFLPAAGEASPHRVRLATRPVWVAIAMNLVAVVVVGGIWSAHAFGTTAGGGPARSYIATARLALRSAPAGSRIVSTQVPASVMSPAFGDASYTANVLGPLAPRSAGLSWTRSPSGPIGKLAIFDAEGRLWPAAVSGVQAVAPPGKLKCWKATSGLLLRIPLQHALYNWSWFVQFGYSGPTTTLALEFGGRWHDFVVHAGHRDIVLPAPGKGGAVTLQNAGLGAGGCVSYLTVGTMATSPFGQPVPSEPVRR